MDLNDARHLARDELNQRLAERQAQLARVASELKADLDCYAALHAQAYGEVVDAMTLIPYMLEAFMAGDRGFRKGSAIRSAPTKPA